MEETSYIHLKNVSKIFGTVAANKNVSFDVKKGEILALLGENGSGKSTSVNILAGIYSPDSGDISIGGKTVRFSSPKDAIKAGIGMVHQHFKLAEVMTAAENIVMGQDRSLFFNRKAVSKKIVELQQKYGLKIDPEKKIYNMSVSEKQTVEILKILYQGADVLILDEPTAVLTPQEIFSLFDILRKMKEKGCSIIIITHKLAEVMAISDRVTVLRKGETIATVNTSQTTPKQLTEMMVGEQLTLEITRAEAVRSENPLLTVNKLTKHGSAARNALDNVSFELYGGEIFGVAGIAGSGQKELCEAISGIIKADGGSVTFLGEEILGLNPRNIAKKGISMSFVPEDRLGMGLVAGMNITSNVLLKSYDNNKGIFLDRDFGKQLAEDIVEKYSISTPSINHTVKKLSGGNIQKVLIGREITLEPKILITAYPVRGLDIGASYNIYDILNHEKQKGVGVLFIGEDLDVLMSMCDRIMVLHDGEITGILDYSEFSKEKIGLMMMGQKVAEENA